MCLYRTFAGSFRKDRLTDTPNRFVPVSCHIYSILHVTYLCKYSPTLMRGTSVMDALRTSKDMSNTHQNSPSHCQLVNGLRGHVRNVIVQVNIEGVCQSKFCRGHMVVPLSISIIRCHSATYSTSWHIEHSNEFTRESFPLPVVSPLPTDRWLMFQASV